MERFKEISCTVNGSKVTTAVDVRESLTDFLRNDLDLKSVKKGCEAGECGACTVNIDGETYNSCLYLAIWADGKNIRTLEGFSGQNGEISDIQQAFIDEGAIQCGFCTPGMIVSAENVLEKNIELSRDEIRSYMAGNLCRCTGYENIVTAIEKTIKKRKQR
jgi:carbon-monoxide dehydrogenase small subunit